MTVSTTNNKNVYNGNDVSTIFAYVFKIFNNTELTVIKTFTDGTESVLVLDADYSVSGAGSDAGGTITYPISGDPLATGEIIVIKRVLPETQTTDLRNQGAWNPEVVEDEFDKSRMIDLQQQESINRSLKTPESELTVIGTLPTVDQRAQKVLSFDDNGDPVYPENSLQLSVDLSQNGTFTATVRVKQGFTGVMEDALDRMLKVTTGSIQINQEHVADQIEYLQDKIELEEYRLTKREERLVARFARLERTLALLQNQMAALGLGMM